MRDIFRRINFDRRAIRANIVIHSMAIAHAITALVSIHFGFKDAIPLSVLTISMIFIVCAPFKLALYTTASIALLCSFFGEFIGTYASIILSSQIENANIYITLVITEAIGWATYYLATVNYSREKTVSTTRRLAGIDKSHLWHLYFNSAIIALIILSIRLGYMEYYSLLQQRYNLTFTSFIETFSTDYVSIIAMILASVIAILKPMPKSLKNRSVREQKVVLWLLYLLLQITASSLVVTILLFRSKIQTLEFALYKGEIFFSFIIITLFNIIIIGVSLLAIHIRDSKIALANETKYKQDAEYRYLRFKKQLDPHFLFNSLNMLENLVYEGTPDQASEYIGKLAGIYRYFLLSEDKITVFLEEELQFVEQYTSLLKIRFGEALAIKLDIDNSCLNTKIVACSLQLLIENAAKHNIISPRQPLHINIYTQEDMIIVENNLQPKISEANNSTKFGLNSLKEQFTSISGRDIVVDKTNDLFIVKLPLI